MGVYPTERWVKGSVTHADGEQVETVTNYYDTHSGIVRVRVFECVAEFAFRDNCFCCSCSSILMTDPYCRNHGFAGTRPCEVHDMPGEADEETGVMPDSVQTIRAARRSWE